MVGDSLNSDDNPNLIGEYLVEYVDAIKVRAEANHLPVLDMYREGIINKYNASTFLTDGLHPTDLGQEMIGKKISGFLDAKF